MSGKEKKAEKLRGMFFTYLFDMSWKLAISFLLPFFVAMVLAQGDKAKILVGFAVGIVLSTFVIVFEVKKINKALRNV